MKPSANLKAYFQRIGYNGPAEATVEVLKELHRLHPQTLTFENLNPLLRIPVRLDIDSLLKKLVYGRRGGYCFEQNLLFKHVLESLGFKVKGLAARILWNQPEGQITSRGHMLLLIELDGQNYVADVGFGGLTLTAPLLLKPDLVQSTPHEPYRLLRVDEDTYVMETEIKEEWKPIYRFDLQEQLLPDYEVTNWYLSNHPESHFVTGLIAARAEIEPARRYALRGNELSIHIRNKGTEKRTIGSVSELKEVLENDLLISLPNVPDMEKRLKEIIR